MSPSENIPAYVRGWADLMKLVRNGYAWSGGERNRFFLNGRNGRFHEMSHLAGLDHPEDGRGLAIVDWDQDGRLDLWYRNRNAPRLRLMMNRRQSPPALSLRLEGTTCNRDAIGAVVELLPAVAGRRLIRTVKAGDLFLSQSSKSLHFGLADESGTRKARVIWPGGGVEFFDDLKAGRFLLKQGTGTALPLKARPAVNLAHKPLVAPKTAPGARIILPARVLFPTPAYRDPALKMKKGSPNDKPRLLVLWSGTCPDCQAHLRDVAAEAASFRKAGLDVLALAVDGVAGAEADRSPSYELIDSLRFPFPWGFIDAGSAREIHQFQERLFDRTPTATVPLAVLLDADNRALAIYRGDISAKIVLEDFQSLKNAHPVQLHHLAPPLGGTWFTNPLPQRDVDRLFNQN